jgi:hypothetical protein
VPAVSPPKLISRQRIADGATRRNYAPALKVLGIARGDRRWPRARGMLKQVAAIYLVDDAVAGPVKKAGNARKGVKAGNTRKKGRRLPGVEETPAGQIAALEDMRRLIKAQVARGEDPNPFFPHPYEGKKSQLAPLRGAKGRPLASQKPRHPAALPAAPEMLIATELRAIELATPELSVGAKYIAAIDAAIDRLKGTMSTGRKPNWALDAMIDRLVDVAAGLDPAIALYHLVNVPADLDPVIAAGLDPSIITAARKRLCDFISDFMVHAMRMKQPDIDANPSRFIPKLRRRAQRRAAHRREMLKTEQGQAVAARNRQQNEQDLKLLHKLQGRGASAD